MTAKHTIILCGRTYDSRRVLRERYGVSDFMLAAWKSRGILPKPVKMGRAEYFDTEFLEAALLAAAQ